MPNQWKFFDVITEIIEEIILEGNSQIKCWHLYRMEYNYSRERVWSQPWKKKYNLFWRIK